jgi:hypothetical protein
MITISEDLSRAVQVIHGILFAGLGQGQEEMRESAIAAQFHMKSASGAR